MHDFLAHLLTGPVERFALPGLHGLNFVLHGALDGGGTASLRHDPQGKAFAGMLMDYPVPIPAAWLARHPRLPASPRQPCDGDARAGERANPV